MQKLFTIALILHIYIGVFSIANSIFGRLLKDETNKAKKNKLFDCPLITFQRVGRSVGIFFFFDFQMLNVEAL